MPLFSVLSPQLQNRRLREGEQLSQGHTVNASLGKTLNFLTQFATVSITDLPLLHCHLFQQM